MKKLWFILLAGVLLSPLCAAQDKVLAFYQRAAAAKGKTIKQDRAFASVLAQDMAQWVRAYPDNPEVKTALLLQAGYHQRAQQLPQALVALYQVRFYFPASQDVAVLSTQTENIMDELNRAQKAQALKLLATDTTRLEGLQARRAALLTHLVQADLKYIYAPVVGLFEDFFTQYPDYEAMDKMTLLYGDWHRQNDNFLAAITAYKKVYELYPSTVYKAAAMRMMADVYAFGLTDYDTATALYNQVLKEYPNSAEIGVVYKHLAVVSENQKQYDNALHYYDKAIAQLGAQPAAFEAWQGKADVLGKTKDYQAQYNTLLQGSEFFTADESKYISLLEQAAKVAQKRLKRPSLQAAALDKILVAYPQTHRAPEFLYEAALANEKQGKTAQALQLYKQIVIHHPTDKYAGRAQSRLNKLEK